MKKKYIIFSCIIAFVILFKQGCGSNSHIELSKDELNEIRGLKPDTPLSSADATAVETASSTGTTSENNNSTKDAEDNSDDNITDVIITLGTATLLKDVEATGVLQSKINIGNEGQISCSSIKEIEIKFVRSDGESYIATFPCGADITVDSPIAETGTLPFSDIKKYLKPGTILSTSTELEFDKQGYAWDNTLTKGAPYGHTFELQINAAIIKEDKTIAISSSPVLELPEFYYTIMNESLHDSNPPISGSYDNIDLTTFSFGPCSVSGIILANYSQFLRFIATPDRHLILKSAIGWSVLSYTYNDNSIITLNPVAPLNSNFPEADNAAELSSALGTTWQWSAPDNIKQHVLDLYGTELKSWSHFNGPNAISENSKIIKEIVIQSNIDTNVKARWCNLDDDKLHF